MTSGALGLVLLATFLTFSRSAWLGTIVAAVTFAAGFILSRSRVKSWLAKHKKVIGVIAIGAVMVAGTLYAARNTYFIQNVIFHADESTVLEDPNELRLLFWRDAIQAIKDNPAGYGPGSAGFSSIKNEKQRVIFTENYYLQVGREAGVLGLLLFLVIIFMVAKRLLIRFKNTRNLLILSVIASFAGLAVSNLFAHIWFNETVAYTWWGLASLYSISPTVANKLKRAGNK